MKDVTLSIRIEESLRDELTAAAALVDRPVAEIVRDSIRGIINKIQSERTALSPVELAKRRRAVDFARANVELEGMKGTPEFNAMMERLARGEIEIEDVDRYTAEKFAHRRVKQ
ncbi:MAG: antitoxin VbhA family protein [Candidatus Accumulibacter sp.]|jgi:hypothetical protein|nr:antitoxin VbhA family protein [Accumulibacter sp.]